MTNDSPHTDVREGTRMGGDDPLNLPVCVLLYPLLQAPWHESTSPKRLSLAKVILLSVSIFVLTEQLFEVCVCVRN
jgi:hypothetical protein